MQWSRGRRDQPRDAVRAGKASRRRAIEDHPLRIEPRGEPGCRGLQREAPEASRIEGRDAFDAQDGKILWRATLDGAAGGGVVTYAVDGQQRVAFVAGTNSPIWPVEKKTAKVVVFGR